MINRMLGRAFLCSILALSALSAGAEQLFAYVDFNHLIINSVRGKAIPQQLQEEFSQSIDDLRSEEAAVTAMRSRIREQSTTLPQQKIFELRRELEKAELQLKWTTEDVESVVQERKNELFNVLEKDVLDLLEKIRQEKGLALILSKQASGFVAADTSLDLTNEAIQRLNARQ